jgi:hypothetical protein
MNLRHQLLVYADDTNLLGESTNIINENTGAWLASIKKTDLEVSTKKIKYIFMYIGTQYRTNIQYGDR